MRRVALFCALLSAALAMGAALAHALELPNKMQLAQADYFVVQQIYNGWSSIGWLLLIELTSMIWVAALYRHDRRVLVPVLVAIAGLASAQTVFWFWTFPANAATGFWTLQPENWRELRSQWEFSHLAGAGLQLLAFSSLVIAALRRGD